MFVKKTIEDMYDLANSRGFKCLSKVYVNVLTALEWKCSKGHIWTAKPVNIINGNGCPECSNRKRLTIEDMQNIAKARGGECLSTEFKTNKTSIKWKCSQGHTWEARADNVKNQGHWCPSCNRSAKLTIEEMQRMAEKRGGKCLSKFYTNSISKLKWECQKGHIWEAKPAHIRNSNSWCPTCALENLGGARRFTLPYIQKIAASKGGQCLSEIYVNSTTTMDWQCEYGHVWKAKASSILSGYWCHVCSNRKRHDIDSVREYAKSRGGMCLSNSYKNNRTKLIWKCSEGHIWSNTFHEIKDGNTWCPQCYKFFSEEKVRFIFEFLFNKPFLKTRKALDTNLELDGFNEELQLAFEYQGIQHYKYDSYFYKTIEEFEKRKNLDLLKVKKCIEKDVKLVIIPYNSYIDDKSLADYIFVCLDKLKLVPNVSAENIPFNLFYSESPILNELRAFALKNKGLLISNFYINSKTALEWQCHKKHIWKAKPNSIKNGSWCPVCAGTVRKTINDMKELAEKKGGLCLSENYVNSKTKLLWQCDKGHIWETIPNVIVNGRWCPECSGKKKLTIEDMKKAAEEKGGKCLSTKYPTDGTRLEWICSKGHTWKATSNNIRRGQWCRKCSGYQKLTIEEMKEIAKSRRGECLSEYYRDSKSHLRWRCDKGHEWDATPNNIKIKEQWCPICSRIKRSK